MLKNTGNRCVICSDDGISRNTLFNIIIIMFPKISDKFRETI